MDCVTIGDSIAVGIGRASHCYQMAAIGRTAYDQAALIKPINIDTAIISLGTNRPTDPNLNVDLVYVRTNVKANKVVWIIPYNKDAAKIVRSVAASFGDKYVELSAFPTSDDLHPNKYGAVAKQALKD